MTKKVLLELTEEQAVTVKNALDLYSRIGIGQLEEVAEVLKRQFDFKFNTELDASQQLTPVWWDEIKSSFYVAKAYLGFERGASYGISHKDVSVAAKRAYEVFKVLSKALAEDRHPPVPTWHVDLEGITFRTTQDVEPKAKVVYNLEEESV